MLSDLILIKSFPAGLRRVRAHRAAGHQTVLITGALDIAVEPLRPLFDHIIAAKIDRKDGKLTGEMLDVPPTGEVRAQLMVDWAEKMVSTPNRELPTRTQHQIFRCSKPLDTRWQLTLRHD